MRFWIVPLVVGALLAGGQAVAQRAHRRHAADPAATTAPGKTFPFDVTWVLRSIDGKPLPVSDPPSFSIDTTLRARGFGGCNTFSMASYPVRNQTLASGAIAMTRNACPPAAMALEREVMVALHSEPRWTVLPDGDLTLAAGRKLLLFHRGV